MGGRVGHVPPKIREKYFSGNYYVKFGNFVNFSGKNHLKFGHFVNFPIFHTHFRAQISCPLKLTEFLRLWFYIQLKPTILLWNFSLWLAIHSAVWMKSNSSWQYFTNYQEPFDFKLRFRCHQENITPLRSVDEVKNNTECSLVITVLAQRVWSPGRPTVNYDTCFVVLYANQLTASACLTHETCA